MARSKRYKAELQKVDKTPVPLQAAVKKLKTFASTKFDQTVECVMHLGIDPKQADQMIRGAISLPHGIGQARRVIAFCDDSEVAAAKAAGAVEAGCDDLIQKVQDGWSEFDVAIASPKVMGKVGKLGRVLGPQGKMPSPKNGTVTPNVVEAVGEFAAGKVEFRNDAGGNVHAVVGKLSFEEGKLVENIDAFLSHIKRLKPSTAKGTYIKKVCISATMSPGIVVDYA
ncbi:MAG TPA: 50S ribosomal protein L1 [Anaerohalosphaeraceae bacterium]|jgi:large subunit ribosomal protein L1|nr:50S ribosomal protein L1 [Anaerohalosphaeraceae bacterium]HRT49249.1 50S ribosomal protein L1 [Anaerohalosphaeraceae bacterium]HRT85212.1 50S ribosomal protein L1 [Anaerohalosphaeraceae bacterium]